MSFIVNNPIRGNTRIFDKDTKICSITLSRKPNGEYYASVNYSYTGKEVKKIKKANTAVGVDRGVTTTATCSNKKVFNIEPMNKINERIKFYQKQLFRKKKGSNNRNKVRIKIAKLHHKKSNIKKDFNHKLSHYLVKSHDLVVLENLKVKNMTKRAKEVNVKVKSELSRSILENNWGQLKQFVEYKAELYGKHLVLVKPANTSRRCSECKHTEKDNRKGKTFHCLSCGHEMDADLNASINIKEDGLSLFAGGEFELSNSLKQELEKQP